MPTFLVTKNMPPALAARIQAAVLVDLRQRTLFPGRGRTRKYVRAALGLASLCLIAVLVVTYRQSRLEVQQKRAALLADYDRLSATSSQENKLRVRALTTDLARLASPAGEWRDVGDSDDLAKLAARPMLYVRGDAHALDDAGDARLAARDSGIDALPVCLVTPPENLRESTLLRAIGRMPAEGRVFALSEALLGLDFLDSGFSARVRSAEMQELMQLQARLERPTRRRAVTALGAEVLLVAVDEPKAAGVVSDFDGEAPHALRLTAVDIMSGRVLWQRRVHVDPAWISEKSRLAYSRALDSCRLAHELLHPPEPTR